MNQRKTAPRVIRVPFFRRENAKSIWILHHPNDAGGWIIKKKPGWCSMRIDAIFRPTFSSNQGTMKAAKIHVFFSSLTFKNILVIE
jgi:hypothetical protein